MKSHLSRIVALAYFLDTVCWLVRLCNEMRHTDDFIFFVIFDHISLLDYRHEVLSMANLALQSAPNLRSYIVSPSVCHGFYQSGECASPQDRDDKVCLPGHETGLDQSPMG